MNERTTLEVIAPTVEEALHLGLTQLGLPADAVSVEVLDSGTKGFLGLGGRQVRVRLTVNPVNLGFTSENSAPRTERKPAFAKKVESSPKQKQPKSSRPVEKKPAPDVVEEKIVRVDQDKLLDTTEEVVSKLIYHLGMQAQVSANYDETTTDDHRSIHVDVRGEDLSSLIGRHAETLTAFQHVASLIVGKQTQQWVQLSVDVEGYRSRREKQLRQMASRMADQVTKTGRKATLEPMTANERRVVHIELRGHPTVTTESTGEDPYRKVVILPKES